MSCRLVKQIKNTCAILIEDPHKAYYVHALRIDILRVLIFACVFAPHAHMHGR
jgi:hypothetical protein